MFISHRQFIDSRSTSQTTKMRETVGPLTWDFGHSIKKQWPENRYMIIFSFSYRLLEEWLLLELSTKHWIRDCSRLCSRRDIFYHKVVIINEHIKYWYIIKVMLLAVSFYNIINKSNITIQSLQIYEKKQNFWIWMHTLLSGNTSLTDIKTSRLAMRNNETDIQ